MIPAALSVAGFIILIFNLIINRIHILNFRNHKDTVLGLNKSMNVIHGRNGSGKTSILEAIYMLGMSKSFQPVTESNLVMNGEETFRISSRAENQLGVEYKININYSIGKKKIINSSHGDNLLPKEIIGELPVVVLTPDFKSITFGPPAERRLFVDRLLSQCSKLYLEDLFTLRKCLKQRNNLLSAVKGTGRIEQDLFELWTNELIKVSASIILKRAKFIQDFKDDFNVYYQRVSKGRENVGIIYKPYGIGELQIAGGIDDIITHLQNISAKLFQLELKRASTQFGPQKDEFYISINGNPAREYASQGQHKSLLISIKFAEFQFLQNLKQEIPIILLDDIFSELDSERTSTVMELLAESTAQTLITTTNPELIHGFAGNKSDFAIENGTLK